MSAPPAPPGAARAEESADTGAGTHTGADTGAGPGERQPRSPLAGRSTVYAPNGAAATSHPLASGAALGVLHDGGNAVDAAVAAAAVLGVVEPHMTGIGGDVFAMVWSATERRLLGLDASGLSGSRMTREALGEVDAAGPRRGAHWVTVPGALAGWAALLERSGTRPLADVLQPAIALAADGFPVSPIIASQWASHEAVLAADPGARATYLPDGVHAPRTGEWFRNPELADAMRMIAAQGPRALYGGALGQRVASTLDALGGFVTLEDLRDYRPAWVEPISVDFMGHQVWELPPSGQGVAALQMLRMLRDFDLGSLGHNSAPYLHLLVEAKKLAFADLDRYVSDRSTLPVSVEALLDDAYLAGRAALIDPARAAERVDPGAAATSGDTVYLAVADRQGNMVSFINSVFEGFGSGVVAPGTGFALQNRGAGFALEEGHPNRVAPRKRPMHTLIPGFVTRAGEPWMAFGVMGGAMQPQGHVQMLLNLLVFGMDLQDAVDAPRFRHLAGRQLGLEAAEGAVADGLAALGHELVEAESYGGAQAVMRLERGWAAASDPRKDGMAVGY